MSTKKLQVIDYTVKQAENADTLDNKHASDFAAATDMTTAQSDISDLQTKVGDTAVATQITNALDAKLDKSGGTMTGDLDMGQKSILDATSVTIVTSEISNYSTNLDGTYGQNPLCVSTDQGRYELIFGGGKIGGVQNPSNDNDAANKKYIDDIITSSASTTTPKIAGTAAVGSETTFARGDHVHPAQTTISGNAGSATKLATSRTIQTDLSSTSTASFNGTANVTPGVTGTLPIANGGTGQTTAVAAAEALINALSWPVARCKLLLTRASGWSSGASVSVQELADCDAALVLYCSNSVWNTVSLRSIVIPVGKIGVMEAIVNIQKDAYLTVIQRQLTVASNGTVTAGEVWMKSVNSKAASDSTSYPYACSPYMIYGLKR